MRALPCAPMSTKSNKSESAAFSAGVFLFIGCVALGAFAGLAFPAVRDDSGFAEVTTWLATTDIDGTFNWGVFMLFGAAGIICFAIGVVGQAITEAIRSTQRQPEQS